MGTRILIVDDEECIRYTFGNFLTDSGYKVSEAGSYDEAICLLQGQEFDLIIVDVILPGKSGLDLLRKVKQTNPLLPVVVITGGPCEETATEVHRLGAAQFLIKPVRQDALLRAAGTALQQ